MRQEYQKFLDRDAEILAVGPEDAETLRRYWVQNDLPYPGLADPEHQAADAYGQEFRLLKMGRLPALVVIDKTGRIRYSHYGDSMQDIPPNAEVLGVLDQLNKENMAATEERTRNQGLEPGDQGSPGGG